MAKFTVVFDACVLYPAPLRDLLIQLATANLFQAKWTKQIHAEWVDGLLANRPDLSRDSLARTCALMDRAVPDCLVENYEYLLPAVKLPDPNDRHVVAAALHSRSGAVVTFNLADFPAAELARFNIEAIHPDDFLTFQADLDLAVVLSAAKAVRARLNSPRKSAAEYLATLQTMSLPKTASLLRQYEALI